MDIDITHRKITCACSENVKEELIYELSTFSIEHEDECLFLSTLGKCIGTPNCAKCIENNIEWEAADEQEET